VNATASGLRKLNTVIDTGIEDDCTWAQLDANWSSAQLRRWGVTKVWLHVLICSDGTQDCQLDLERPLVSAFAEGEHTWRVDLPPDYATAENGDHRLLQNFVRKYVMTGALARGDLARGTLACMVFAEVDQVLARVAQEWREARQWMTGMATLMGT
jgi:hypothetical protein